MKPILPIGAFLAAVLIAAPLFAKVGDPIVGVPIGLEGDPGSVVISQKKTDSEGVAVFKNVKPGKYRLVVYIATAGGGVWKTDDKSKGPAIVIKIDVPGQAAFKITENESPRPADTFLVPFTVTGNEVKTFTATISWGDGSK
jgi:hypothetical protein